MSDDWQGDKMEGDYEGGRWIGGDFYYKSEKKNSRKVSKESSMLGVFGDSDDEDARPSFASRRGGGLGGAKPKVDYSKPMAFVSSGSIDPAKREPEPIRDVEMMDEEDRMDVDDAFGMPDSKRRKLASGEAEQKKKKKKKQQQQELPTHEVKNIGNWEKFTKGIGAKLLKKMGWQEGKGLGPELQGIAAPIEAKVRRDKGGLEEGEFKGSELGRWKAESSAEEEEEAEEDEAEAKEPGWKRTAAGPTQPKKKQKTKYLTASEAAEEAKKKSSEQAKQIIVDMRGPQVRVLNSVDQALLGKGEEAIPAVIKPKFLPELQHNVAHVVDMKATRLHTIEVKKRHDEQQLAALRREEAALQHRMAIQEESIVRLQDIQKVITGCRDRAMTDSDSSFQRPSASVASQGANGPLTLEFVAKVFELLRGKFPSEYRKYKLEALAVTLVFPLLTRKLKDWNPLTHPEYGVAMIKAWRTIFEGPEDPEKDTMDMDDEEFEEDFFGRKNLSAGNKRSKKGGEFDLFNRLLFEVVIPKFRATIVSDWNVKDPAPLISLLVSWSDIIPKPIMDMLLSSAVLPRLQAAVESWDPRRDTVPIHVWVLPWLRMIGDSVKQSLFEPIQKKLASTLQQWQVTDRSALAILRPWHTVFEAGPWERLLLKSIIPKLLDALRNKFTIDPAQQEMSILTAVLQWLDVTPIQHFVTLFDLEFFPKFFQVLYAWLQSEQPDYDDITAWYMSWKKVVPDVLQNQDRIKQLFAYALKMMNSAIAADTPDQILPPPPVPVVTSSTFAPSRVGSTSASAKPATSADHSITPTLAAAAPKKKITTFMDTVSLKELLDQMASDRNILFMPARNKMHLGKPVYQLGGLQVWFDKDVVHKYEDGRWVPTMIDDVLEEAAAMQQ